MTPAERNQNEAFKIVGREGSAYTNRPHDNGGPTKFGITLKTLAYYRAKPMTPLDVENLTLNDAVEIYITLFMNRPRFSQIKNDHLFELAVDSGVQHGVMRAARWLQHAVGAVEDGIIGPVTLAKVNGGNTQMIYDRMVAVRLQFYTRIIAEDPTQQEFATGWKNRMKEFSGRIVVQKEEAQCSTSVNTSPSPSSEKPNWPWLGWRV